MGQGIGVEASTSGTAQKATDAEQEFYDWVAYGDYDKVRQAIQESPHCVQAEPRRYWVTPTKEPQCARRSSSSRSNQQALPRRVLTTPLHCGVRYAPLDVVELLVQAVPPTALAVGGRTVLHSVAKRSGSSAATIARCLIEQKADVNAVDVTGKTALHVCAEKNNGWVAAALLSRGAVANCMLRETGSTPLHIALGSENVTVSEVLLAGGADLSLCRDVDLTDCGLHTSRVLAQYYLARGDALRLAAKQALLEQCHLSEAVIEIIVGYYIGALSPDDRDILHGWRSRMELLSLPMRVLIDTVELTSESWAAAEQIGARRHRDPANSSPPQPRLRHHSSSESLSVDSFSGNSSYTCSDDESVDQAPQ